MNRLIVKYNGGNCNCQCGGQIMFDGEARERLPIGLGFRGSKFVIDCVERRGWIGECLECGKPIFAVKSQRHVTRGSRSINAKIRRARGQ